MKSWWSDLVALSEEQQGLFTAAQAGQVGVSRVELGRMVERGVFDRLQHGVYALAGGGVGQFLSLRAAWLAIAPQRRAADRLADAVPDAVVSHATAAVLLDLGDLDADRHEFTSTVRRRTRNPEVAIHQGDIPEGGWMVHQGLPVTTPTTTVAALARSGIDQDHLGQMVRDCIVQWDCTVEELATVLDPVSHRYGQATGAALVELLVAKAEMPHAVKDYYGALSTWRALPQKYRLPAQATVGTALAEQLSHIGQIPAAMASIGQVPTAMAGIRQFPTALAGVSSSVLQSLAVAQSVQPFAKLNPSLTLLQGMRDPTKQWWSSVQHGGGAAPVDEGE